MLSFKRQLKVDVSVLGLDDCIQILALPFASCVILNKLFTFSDYI